MTSRNWLTEPPGSEDDMNLLVAGHQALLSDDVIVAVVRNLPAKLQSSLQAEFLEAVMYYHLQHRVTDGEQDWQGARQKFHKLVMQTGNVVQHDGGGGTPLLRWYIKNYLFLSCRNLGMGSDVLQTEFEALRNDAEKMADPQRQLLLGFILYNWARLLLKEKNVTEGAAYYMLAGVARARYYLTVKHQDDQNEIKRAATQVWKIRKDWGGLIGDTCLPLPVNDELFAEVAVLADPTFSAVKK
jgi:hypothetical protein